MKKAVFLLIFLSVCAFGKPLLDLPLRWDGRGYIVRMSPKDHNAFVDGMLYGGVEVFEIAKPTLTFKLAAVKWTMMAFSEDGIIFDPTYMQFSLQPSVRLTLNGHYMEFIWEHDCFHDIDRVPAPGTKVIWNAYALEFGQNNHIARIRLDEVQERAEGGFYWDPYYSWSVRMALLPHDDESIWLQRNHNIEGMLRSNLMFSPGGFGTVRFEMEYHPLLYTHRDGAFSDRHYAQIGLTYYSQISSVTLLWGYTFAESQPVRPNPRKARLGLFWRI